MEEKAPRDKRLFIGFPVEVGSSLQASLKRTKIGAQQKGMEVYWIPPANFHVTLCFLGSTSPDKVPALEGLLRHVSSESPPIETSLRGMGGFPDERHMRVLYVGVRKSRALASLQDRLRSALVDAGFPQEDRDYHPHLTVARLRKARSATDLLSPYVRTSFGDIRIGSMILYESVLQGSHPVYNPVARFELTGEPPSEEEESFGAEPPAAE